MFITYTVICLCLLFSIALIPFCISKLIFKWDIKLWEAYSLGYLLFFGAFIFLDNVGLGLIVALSFLTSVTSVIIGSDLKKIAKFSLGIFVISLAPLLIYYWNLGIFGLGYFDSVNVGQDDVWHIGLASAFARLGPYNFIDPHIFDTTFVYHFFAHNMWARTANLLNVPMYEVVLMGLRPAAMILGFSVAFSIAYDYTRSIFKSIYVVLGIFFSFGFFTFMNFSGDVVGNIFPTHLFFSATGEEFVFSVFLVGLYCLYKIFLKQDTARNTLIYFSSLVLALGFKGPYGLALVGIGSTLFPLVFLSWQRLRRDLLVVCILGLSVFFLAFILYYRGSAGLLSIGHLATFDPKSFGFDGHIFSYWYIRLFLSLFYILAFFGPTVLTLLFYNGRARGANALDDDKPLIFAVVAFFIPLNLFICLRQDGNSQLYFAFCAQLGLNFFAWLWISKTEFSSARWLKVVLFVYVAMNILGGLYSSYLRQTRISNVSTNFACRWLRENTPKDSLIAINKQKLPGAVARYFYCSVYAERQFVFEGFEYNDRSFETVRKIKELSEVNRWIFDGSRAVPVKYKPNYIVFFRNSYGDLDFLERAYDVVYSDTYAVIFRSR